LLAFNVTVSVTDMSRVIFSQYNKTMEIDEVFSRNLIRIRKLRGLSQRELGKKAGISYRMINHYEKHPNAIPISKLKIIADALNVQIADFFREDKKLDSLIEATDVRLLKKLHEIQALSDSDRKEINRHINTILEKAHLHNEKKKSA
jgi:transcriptional regulator with XRE-family HTH domain